MADRKNQHYVPRHYLKRFCHVGTKLISLVHLESKRFVPIAPIDSQCSEDYFYGKDGKLEAILGQIEHNADPLFERILATQEVPYDRPSRKDLIGVMAMLYSRTKRRIDEMSAGPEAMLKESLLRMHRAGLLPEPPPSIKIENVKVSLTDAPALAIYHTFSAIHLMADLGLKLLLAPPGIGFIASDHPVVVVNEMFHASGVLGAAGLANRGLQMFLPISPSCCVVAYDAECYRISRPEKRSMQIERAEDMDLLNALQVINADEHLYFHDPSLSAYVFNLLKRFKHLRGDAEHKIHRVPVPKPDGDEGLLIIPSSPGVTPPGKWSFCKKRVHWGARDFGPRDPELCRLVRQWSKETSIPGKAISFGEWLDQSGYAS